MDWPLLNFEVAPFEWGLMIAHAYIVFEPVPAGVVAYNGRDVEPEDSHQKERSHNPK